MYIEWVSSDKSLQAVSSNSLLKTIIIPTIRSRYKLYLDVESLKCTFDGVVAKNINNNNMVSEGQVRVTCSGTWIGKNLDLMPHITFYY